MRILCANDDGIHAPGLKTLEKIANALSDDVWVVAPETEQSGAGHSLTLAHPLRLRKINKRRFAVSGTPTDCVLMAVHEVMADTPPDLVLSGVNRGQNIADDVTYSGTIAAAMEGTALGIPSIALSQAYGFEGRAKVKWTTAEHHGAALVSKLVEMGWPADVLMNVNFPDVAAASVEEVEVTVQGKRDQNNALIETRMDARDTPYYWLGFGKIPSNPAEGTDLRAIYAGRISVTPLHMDLTHKTTRRAMAKEIGGTPPKAIVPVVVSARGVKKATR
ncbi:5'/3'-nucleotidase SurE [Pyruvatibacter sp.]|uniref:5'/3'-nucleotidase SurE n=1 Tax=Pyruvatibacter sp. TaxID=1981328 RepID=UPI0032F00219